MRRKTMDTTEIIDAIFDVKTNGELNQIFTAVRAARGAIGLRSRGTWYVGQEVSVVERNRTTLGTVLKVNRTRCKVQMREGKYNVPMTMLEEV